MDGEEEEREGQWKSGMAKGNRHVTQGCSSRWRLRLCAVAVCGAALAVTACSLGVTKVTETHYIAVPSGNSTNYFRVRIDAYTSLSKTKFQSGWFPAEAVDGLYGSADEAGVADAYKTRNDIREQYNRAIFNATSGYLAAANDPATKPEVLEAWLRAERRVRATAGNDVALPTGATEIEYDPASSLAVRHAGEKLVFILSSNPDDVIGAIANFSTDAQTGATVLQFADLMRQRSSNEVTATESRNDANAKLDAVVVDRIDSALKIASGTPTAQDLMREIQSLRLVLETVR